MKRGRYALFLLLFAVLRSACGQKDAERQETDWSAGELAWAVMESQGGGEGMEVLTPASERFGAYLKDYYGLDAGAAADGVILFAGGTSALEAAVLDLGDADAAREAVGALENYIAARTGAFAGYLPEQAAILERAEAVSRGRFAALLICADMEAAKEAFAAGFREGAVPPAVSWSVKEVQPEPELPPDAPEEPLPPSAEEAPPVPEPAPEPEPEPEPEVPEEAPPLPGPEPGPDPTPAPEPEPEPELPAEETPWEYDRGRLAAAWAAGDWSGLAERDRAMLDVCAGAFAEVVTGEMSAYETELALHDWMLDWGRYDSDTLSHLTGAQPDPDNDNPYGFLVGHRGICLGYACTFQLLMDLAGIECVTVEGHSSAGTADHAWNMVRLDGEWYCVDVTWDDPSSELSATRENQHRYFNQTSEFFRRHDHQWDERGVEEALGTAWAWQG